MSVQGGGGGGGSDSNSGQYQPYVPDETTAAQTGDGGGARRKRSPWPFVGAGCGLIALMLIVAAVVGLSVLERTMKEAMSRPLDRAALQRRMADVPQYPGAVIDERTTQSASVVTGLMSGLLKPGQSIACAAYVTPDDDGKIVAEYDKAMKAAGYEAVSTEQSASDKVSVQRMYRKGGVIVFFGIPNEMGRASFLVMRMEGFGAKDAAAAANSVTAAGKDR